MRPAEPIYVLVSGPPGSGKSTMAPQIAAHLGLPLVAKDTIKEALMSHQPPTSVEASRRLGRAAVAVLYAVATDAPRGAVLESVFYRSRALPDVRALPGLVVEVFCSCDRDVALDRYKRRAGRRHAGHFDHERTAEEVWAEVSDPVAGGWPVLVVETNQPVDVGALLRDVDRLVAGAGRP